MAQDAHSTRLSGELTTPLVDDFDLLSVNHFFNLFDAHYEVLCGGSLSSKDPQAKKQKQTLLDWLKSIKNLRDPLSHPSEEDFSREDSFLLLDSARRVLLRLDLKKDADRIKELSNRIWAGHAPSDLQPEPLESQLPPRDSIVVDFVGRDREMGELWSWFRDPVSRRWALAGEGGKGKSAIAYNFALSVVQQAPAPFQTVFWLTAKKRRFLEGRVVTAEPDFADLDSVLSRILTYYGWVEELSYPVDSKRKRVLELLKEFPALVIVDDIDSLESENENAIEFFSLDLPKETNSKVLFTSRRTIFGMGGTTTHVTGFDEQDAAKFVLSRCQLMELDSKIFKPETIRRITKVTESSPLYIEDLMRFSAAVKSIEEAIDLWAERKGSEARRYALGRECDLLTPSARKILLASCICPHAASFAELEAISGLPSDIVTAALHELQDLFLAPKPKLIEGEQRFDVNVNIRALVKEVYGSDESYRRLEAACKTISEGVPQIGRGAVGAIIRQAVFLERAHNHPEAEQLLLNAFEKYPSNPDLFGVLGKVYKSWQPPRLTDAREKFARACQLKSLKQEMYEQWCQMEIREQEWTKAAVAAEKGLKLLPGNRKLHYLAGYSRSRLAKELSGGLHQGKAKKELNEAKTHLDKALSIPADSEAGDSTLNAAIYRALVLTCEQAGDIKAMLHYFKRWQSEHPDDSDAASEWERISKRYKISSP